VVSATGEPVRLALDGATLAGLPVRFGPAGCVFRAYADGRMALVDGEGSELHLRCDAWPVLRDQGVLSLRRAA
jgi:hypothetical protein